MTPLQSALLALVTLAGLSLIVALAFGGLWYLCGPAGWLTATAQDLVAGDRGE